MSLMAYIPMDRRQALARGEDLPNRCTGAALFADISGFTPLTRAFAEELGSKRGAEALLGVLNPLFEALIAPVHAYGGSVIGFVGDAITCWFDEEAGVRMENREWRKEQSHPPFSILYSAAARAVACALAMQAAMGPLATVRTPGGTEITLSIKVAVAYGPARRFVVGDPSIQQIDALVGGTLARMAAAEKHAAANEVVVSAEVVARLGDNVNIVEWHGGQHFAVIQGLKQPVVPAPWPVLDDDALSEVVARTWLLPEVYALLRGGVDILGDLRPVTLLMLRFGGLDFDADDTAGEKLDAFLCWVQRTVYEHGGNLLQLTIGDKGAFMYSVFGAPVAHEDDILRALHTALTLRDLPPELNRYITPVQIGLTWGEVWTGVCGAVARHVYNAVSSEVNLAARLMAAAQPGQILVSERMRKRRGVSTRFDLEYVYTQVYKGFDKPIPTHALRSERPQQYLFPEAMVGRAKEVQQVQDFVYTCFADELVGVACIYGEAGIGKSHLAYALRQYLATSNRFPVTWFTGQADQLVHQPFNAFVYWLKSYFNQVPEISQEANKARFEQRLTSLLIDLEDLAASIQYPISGNQLLATNFQHLAAELTRAQSFLGALLDLHWPASLYEEVSPQLRCSNTVNAIKTLLLAESYLHPVVFALEDAHWMDAASGEVLTALSHTQGISPLCIVITSRYTEDGAKPGFALAPDTPTLDIELQPLPPAALHEQINALVGGPVDETLYTLVLEKAQANPFFTQQIVFYLDENDMLAQMPRGTWTVKSTDFEIPTSINAILIARIDRLTAHLRQVVQAAAVVGKEFEVQILSHVLRYDVVPDVAQVESKQIWAALNDLRYIFKHALMRDAAYQMQLRVRLRELHQLAAEAIETLHVGELDAYYADLAYHYRQAEVPTKECHYADLAGQRAFAISDNRQAVAFFDRSLALLPENEVDAVQRMQVLEKLGNAHLRLSNYAQAHTYYTRSLALAQQFQNGVGEARALIGLSTIFSQQGQYVEAQEYSERALALQRAHKNLRGVVSALTHLIWVRAHQGDYVSAMAYAQEGLAISEDIGYYQGIADALNGMKWFAQVLGDYTAAGEYATMSLKIYRDIGDHWGEAGALTGLGTIAVVQGNYSAARKHFEASLELRRAMADRRGIANTLNALGAVLNLQDAHEAARMDYQEALTLFRAINDRQGTAYALGNLALTAALLGDLEQALAYAEESLAIFWDIGDRRGASGGLCYLALVQIQRRIFDAARRALYESLQLAQEVASQVNVIWSVLGYAWLYLATGHLERSARLIGLLETGPAPNTTALYMREIRAKLAQVLSPDVLQAALVQGAKLDLDEIAAEIL